jgi:hypothetical protein
MWDLVLNLSMNGSGSRDNRTREIIVSKILTLLQENFLFRSYKYYIIDSVLIVKNRGVKELLRTRGLKFILAVIVYYVIRDSMIYFVIPFLVARGLF